MAITHILFDLDDTLLQNSTGKFLPEYLRLLSMHLGRFAPADSIPMLIMECTAEMQTNTDPNITNFEAFYRPFLARLGLTFDEVQPLIEEFYINEYPALQAVVKPMPHGRDVVEYLFNAGYTVAVATNPLFPEIAVQQRLNWAHVGDFPFALVTTMEIMHFSKPNPRYFEETLALLDVSPENTLMVGDDPERDIASAQAIGLHTWHITDDAEEAESSLHGTLSDFWSWVKNGNLDTFLA